ncbi:MAG TPA: FtsX-like permease family protein, partial [Opitutaceae bacterium]
VQFRVELEPAGYAREQQPAMQMRILERLRTVPGVSDATFTNVPLLNRGRWSSSIGLPGVTPPAGGSISANFNTVAPNFFSALELPLVLGRPLGERDAAGAPRVAVVNQAFVRKFLPDESPVGRTMTMGRNGETKLEIVGVARDAKYTTLRETVQPTVYLSALQEPRGGASYLVRASGDLSLVLPALRAAVREVDPTLPVTSLRPLEEQMELNHSQERLFARLSGFFGVLALALACVGLYGLMSYSVLRRTGEIGLRMALGALPGHVLRMILKESLALVCLGVVLGLTGAYFASRLVATMLYGLSATDPFTYAVAACVLIGVAVVAALLPAHNASRINPMTALRSEDSAR